MDLVTFGRGAWVGLGRTVERARQIFGRVASDARVREGVCIAGAGALGFVWGASSLRWVALSPMVFAAWTWAPRRSTAFGAAFAYHLVAARSLVAGASTYFGVSRVEGLLVVSAGALVLSGAWACLWRARESSGALEAFVRVLLLCVLTYGPGLGAIAIGTPLAAAGVWLPGAGWLGLLTVVGLSSAARTRAGLMFLTRVCVVMAAWGAPAERREPRVRALSTAALPALGELDFLGQWRVARASLEALEHAPASGADVVVLPESAAGLWQEPMTRAWADVRASRSEVVLVGAARPRRDGRFDNVALVLGHGEERSYVQRVPVPLAMWMPGTAGGFAAHWLGRGTVEAGGRLVGVLVCWEAALLWPALQSVAEGADVLVVLANTARLPGGALRALEQGARAWGLLFGLPVAVAANASGEAS